MSIRRRAIIAVTTTIVAIVVVAFVATDLTLGDSIDEIEESAVTDALERVERVIARDVDAMGDLNEDWAAWDDTYAFIVDLNDEYFSSNLPIETLEVLDLDVMLFVDTTGEVPVGLALDRQTFGATAVPLSVLRLASSEALRHESAEDTVEGLILLDERPAIVTSRPIVTSAYEGPVRGAVVMARYLDDRVITGLEEVTGHAVHLAPLDDAAAANASDVRVEIESAEVVRASKSIDDIRGDAAFLLSVSIPRDFHREGARALRYFMVSLVLATALVGVVLMLFLDRWVLLRLVRLRDSVRAVPTMRTPREVEVPGPAHDEIGQLAAGVNETLRTLAETEADLRSATEGLEERVAERTEELARLNSRLQQELGARRELERQLEVAQKLESLGVLAGGIAHDFNNLLSGIMGNASLLAGSLEPGTPASEHAQRVLYAAEEARSLTSQLLTFAQGGSPVLQAVAIDRLITDAAEFALSGTSVTWTLDVADDLPELLLDPGQVSQVLNNIFLNAVQAAPAGTIRVSVAAEDWAGGPDELDPGRYLHVRISDDGPGIPDEHIDRIFDPYFTTKAEGSGLGLATSWSIARRHGGILRAESAENSGTDFHLYLPIHVADAVEQGPATTGAVVASQHVLVMDDEPMILEVAERMLEELGCRSTVTRNGEAAIQAYTAARERGEPFDLAILDMTVREGMGGREAAAELLKLDPNARLIGSSGYSQSQEIAQFEDYGFKSSLPKPYGLDKLSAAILAAEFAD